MKTIAFHQLQSRQQQMGRLIRPERFEVEGKVVGIARLQLDSPPAESGLRSDRAALNLLDYQSQYACPHAKRSPERKNTPLHCSGLRWEITGRRVAADVPAGDRPFPVADFGSHCWSKRTVLSLIRLECCAYPVASASPSRRAMFPPSISSISSSGMKSQ